MKQCEPIKIEVKIGSETKPVPVETAVPEITADGKDIVATSTQKPGYIHKETITVSKKNAQELDANLIPANVKEGVSIFGIEGTIKEPKYQNKAIKANENGKYTVIPDAGIDGMKKVDIAVDVKPPLQDKAVNITRNGTQRYSHDAEFYGMDNVDIKVDVKPNLQTKRAVLSENKPYDITPDEGYDGMDKVQVQVDVHPLLVNETLEFIHPGETEQTTDLSKHPGAYGFGEVKATVSSTDFRATEGDDNHRIMPNNGYAFFDSVYIPVAETVQFKAEHGGQVPLNYYEKPEGQGKVGMKTAIVDIPLETAPEITEPGQYAVELQPGNIGFEGPINVNIKSDAKNDLLTAAVLGVPVKYVNEEITAFPPNNPALKLFNSSGGRTKGILNGWTFDEFRVPKCTNVGSYSGGYLFTLNESNIVHNFETGALDKYQADITQAFKEVDGIMRINTFDYNAQLSYQINVTPNKKFTIELVNKDATGVKSLVFNGFIRLKENSICKIIVPEGYAFLGMDSNKNIFQGFIDETRTGTIDFNFYFESTARMQRIAGQYPKNVIMRSKKMNKIGQAEDVSDCQDTTFYVPDELVDQYKADAMWSIVADKFQPISALPPELQ